MRTDVVIDRKNPPQRLVIDTKFTNVLGRGWYREQSLKTGYVYQLYAYLRSQERPDDPLASNADGLLLHPAIDGGFDESVRIQGHRMRFATVDLAGSHAAIRQRLLELVEPTQSLASTGPGRRTGSLNYHDLTLVIHVVHSTVTSRGQTVVPAPIRERFGLGPSSRLEWIIDSDGSIRVVPVDLDPIRAFRASGVGGSTARLLADRSLDREKER